MKTTDNFGRSHYVYYRKMTEVADTPKKEAGKKKNLKKLEKKQQTEPADLPF